MPSKPLLIGCLGWGSLVWDPRTLPIQREWFKDGPFARVEFSRKSSDGRVTLVIDPNSTPIRLLWAKMLPCELSAAQQALGKREGIKEANYSSLIGSWQRGEASPVHIIDLPEWASARSLDAVVWTALKPTFEKSGDKLPIDQVIEYLHSLKGTLRDYAKQYIERAPRQIDTEYRRQIEAALGWSYEDDSEI